MQHRMKTERNPFSAALWGVQMLLALVFTLTGIYKLVTPKASIVNQLPYVSVYSPIAIQTLGGLEVLAAVGLVVPRRVRIFPWLTPLAALGLSGVMVSALELHLRHGNLPRALLNIVLLTLTAFVVFGRGIKRSK